MGVVKGDKIAESRKLNRCSRPAFDVYAYYVATLRDDFGRFRFSARHAHLALYPRRSDVTVSKVGRLLREFAREGLLRVWEQDGVEWGEWTKYEPSGRRFHDCPEPPWSDHTHSMRCEKSRRRMEQRWGTTGAEVTAKYQPKEQEIAPSPGPPSTTSTTSATSAAVGEQQQHRTIGAPTADKQPPTDTPSEHEAILAPRNGDDGAAPERGRHPFIPDSATRVAYEREALRLPREIAAESGSHADEVMGRFGAWKGYRQLNPANMSDARLVNVVLDMRKELRRLKGIPEPDTPAISPENAEKLSGVKQWLENRKRAEAKS